MPNYWKPSRRGEGSVRAGRQRGPARESVRAPVVAGIFYPERKEPLEQLIDQLSSGSTKKRKVIAVVVPHGAYHTSGEAAGAVYAQLASWPSVSVVVGPNHSGAGEVLSIAVRGDWETPLGRIPVDPVLARAILKAAPDLKKDAKAHQDEHAVEVQLPFLQRLGHIRGFVPVALGPVDLETVQRIGRGLAEGIRKAKQPVLLVASTQLSRYEALEAVKRKDQLAIEPILALDEDRLLQVVAEQGVSMCGATATAVVLVAAKGLGASQGSLVKYETSGKKTGNLRSVVGYAGILLE